MAGYRVTVSTEAKQDLQNILVFYQIRNRSNVYSKKLNDKMRKVKNVISRNPYIGTVTNMDNIRMFVVGHYQVIYEIFEDCHEISIIMFWDCRRNPNDRRIGRHIISK